MAADGETGGVTSGRSGHGAEDGSAEVERLRLRVAELEGALAHVEGARRAGPVRPARWRSVAAGVLIVTACVLAPLSVTSVWASSEVSDVDRYVETVAPLAEDPAVQEAVADAVTEEIVQRLDVEQVSRDALEALGRQPNVPPRVAVLLPGLAVPLVNGVESFTRSEVTALLASEEFATLWQQVNRVAHDEVVNLLEGDQGGAVSAQDGAVTLNLGPVIAEVKNRLVDKGFTLAGDIPDVERSFVLVQSDAVTEAQGLYRVLRALGTWLPLILVALFATGVYLAGDRRRALFRGALGVVGAMVALGAALAVARLAYVSSTPADILDEQAAGNVFDALVRFLRTGLRSVALLGIVVAVGAFLTGRSTSATRIRGALAAGLASLRGGAESVGWKRGRGATWVGAHKAALRIGTVLVAGLVLAFWPTPTVGVVIGVTVVVVLALAVIEFLGAKPAPTMAAAAGHGAFAPGQSPTPDEDELSSTREAEGTSV